MKSCNSTPELFHFYVTRLLVVLFVFITLTSFGGELKHSATALTDNSQSFSSAATPLTIESMRVNLYLLNANNTTILADGVLTEYNDIFHDGVTLEDAYKFTNINENLGLTRYGSVLAVERRPVITAKDTLFMKLWKTTVRNYQFEFVTTRLDHPGMQAFLKDAFLGTSTPLSLTGTTKINFAVTIDPASSGIARFQIVYEQNLGGTLPVNFAWIKGYQQHNKNRVDWKVESEINTERYEVQRSANGTDFLTISSILVSGHNSNYSWTDDQPLIGNNYYRVKNIDRDGSGKFSVIVKVIAAALETASGSIAIYPNPVRGNSINLRFVNQPAGEYQVKLLSSNGQVVYSGKLPVNSSNVVQAVVMSQKLRGGIYQLEIKGPENALYTKQALVE